MLKRPSPTMIETYNYNEILKKACQSLLGICTGLIADNQLNEKEFLYLRHWLLENREAAVQWPGSALMYRIEDILRDGKISTQELEHFTQVLKDLTGFSLQETGSSQPQPTTLPLTPDVKILFPSKRFCFTAEFLYGTRALCHSKTEVLGGIPQDNVTKKLDFLVVGALASTAWINSSYGNKIKKAVDLQNKGIPIMIVSEENWVSCLE